MRGGSYRSAVTPTDTLIVRLRARPDIAAAEAWLRAADGATLDLQRAITAIPAPTFDEEARARFVADRMRAIGLAGVRTDAAGNVAASWGAGPAPGIIIAAHLDTVFAADADCTPREANGRLSAPGIGDNGRGLAAMLALAEACVRCRVAVPARLTFVATVGEEGVGDLRGVKHLFADPAYRPAAFIALDGPGLARVVHRALGIRRARVTYRGPGGHSWAAFGVANPAHAVGEAIAGIASVPVGSEPRAALSVVRLGGGSGLNTIPTEAWLDLDLRSEHAATLAAVDGDVAAACTRALESVNRRRAPGTPPLAIEVTTLGSRPSGATPESDPLVQAALAATRAVGGEPQLAAASTDANVAMAHGIPAIAIGAGGKGGDAHLLSEWYENVGGPDGIVRALLTVLAA
jgi:acetylornithine deacetylase/succinyl-diaminopimelate desuccinylase-like protein